MEIHARRSIFINHIQNPIYDVYIRGAKGWDHYVMIIVKGLHHIAHVRTLSNPLNTRRTEDIIIDIALCTNNMIFRIIDPAQLFNPLQALECKCNMQHLPVDLNFRDYTDCIIAGFAPIWLIMPIRRSMSLQPYYHILDTDSGVMFIQRAQMQMQPMTPLHLDPLQLEYNGLMTPINHTYKCTMVKPSFGYVAAELRGVQTCADFEAVIATHAVSAEVAKDMAAVYNPIPIAELFEKSIEPYVQMLLPYMSRDAARLVMVY
jgi:hypothetical protein